MKKRKTIALAATFALITATSAHAIGSKQKPPQDEASTIDTIISYLIGSKQKPPGAQ